MAYRYWCGECGFSTGWTTEHAGEEEQLAHYARKHPTVPPGGHVEVNRKDPSRGSGCVPFLAVAVLLLILAATCRR